MKKMIQKILFVVMIITFSFGLLLGDVPTAQAATCPDTSIIKVECGEDGRGIGGILQLVLTILTAGVAIAAIAGISIAAFTYTTAGGNEEKVKKSKDRILQIVIGLLVYGIMWAALQWLIPGGVL